MKYWFLVALIALWTSVSYCGRTHRIGTASEIGYEDEELARIFGELDPIEYGGPRPGPGDRPSASRTKSRSKSRQNSPRSRGRRPSIAGIEIDPSSSVQRASSSAGINPDDFLGAAGGDLVKNFETFEPLIQQGASAATNVLRSVNSNGGLGSILNRGLSLFGGRKR